MRWLGLHRVIVLRERAVLRGEKVGLRARRADDIAALYAGLYADVTTRAEADARPWRPLPVDSADLPFAISDRTDTASFSVVTLDDDQLAGDALLWGIDLHNRSAHVGVSLLPEFRGRGLASDVVNVLCTYGFVTRGLHRLQVDTLADNGAMIAVARRCGFALEGTLHRSAWVNGEFVDEVILGRLSPPSEKP
jgi:RimJ/RimL family protein N-acetyltransferase